MTPSDAPPFVVVTGQIAAGKSSLVGALATAMGVPSHHERPDDNPYFAPPAQDALRAEAWFLAQSTAAYAAIGAGGAGGVLERSLEEHVDVFAAARHRHGWLDDGQLATLRARRSALAQALPAPDLLVHLEIDATTAAARIAARARPEERDLPAAYLHTLHALYDDFAAAWDRCPLVRVDAVRVDVRSTPFIQQLVSSIKEHVA